MSEKYMIEWAINGSTEITADSPDEAQSKFEALGIKDLAENGELEVLSGPETSAERDAVFKAWRSKMFPKPTEAANG